MIALTTTFWRSKEEADSRKVELENWHKLVTSMFNPSYCLVACGSAGEPQHNPVPHLMDVVESYVECDLPNNVPFADYGSCALCAAFWHLLFRFGHGMEPVLLMATDVIVGNLDVTAFLCTDYHRFITASNALLLAPAWCGHPDPNFAIWKKSGISHYLHRRRRPNINDSKRPEMSGEEELGRIFEGRWYNPWPTVSTIRQDYGYTSAMPDSRATRLPLVRLPSPATKEFFERKAKER